MINLEELTTKVKSIIESERATNPDIQYLLPEHAGLIAQIVSNYNLTPSSSEKQSADMIFLGAPTGAGKDTLVRKLMLDNPDKDFVILNMDMFRHYHEQLSTEHDTISDKQFARKTNQTSYELYYIIQETILREFPGTNVIVTGTMKDLSWVKDIVKRYKNDPKTNYDISLVTLAVPTNESAFSIYERYLSMVDTRENDDSPLRYTDLSYHNETIRDFINNVRFFEDNMHKNPKNRYFNSIKVYRRHKDMLDLSEDTLIYDSNVPDPTKCATSHIHDIMNSNTPIDGARASYLLDMIKRNSDYLKSQGLYKEILTDLSKILPQLSKMHDEASK